MNDGPVFHVTAVSPEPDTYMPSIEQYTALADAVHDEDDSCNANYYVPAADCRFRDLDIEQAIKMLVSLHKAGWRLERDPGGTAELGL